MWDLIVSVPDHCLSFYLCSLSPTPVMLHIKFDCDWSTCPRDILVRKCERTTDRRTDHWYTISSSCEPSAQVSLKQHEKHKF